MIYDCFLFNNELEILDIRLNELAHVVDKFVLVESTVTHSIKPKPLYFDKHKKKFEQFKHKIIHIVVKDTPDVSLPWIVNDYQFSQMKRGLSTCKPNDIVLFGDVDEIPKAEAIKKGIRLQGKLKVFSQRLCQYYLNYMAHPSRPWHGTRMATYRELSRYPTLWIAKFSPFDTIIPDGGWHFSYMGGIKRIREKFSDMTHQEYNNDRYNTPEKIEHAIREGRDLAYMGWKFRMERIEELPLYVRSHQDKLAHLLLQTPPQHHDLILQWLELKHILRVKFLRKIRKFV